ncbi:MAG: hypothetical protein IAE77_18505 [Prosthecobacter sp.]|jgi:hypothetical protein|uniref:hypothetical protein n=1 Tax=Prosthecobacter sp. TaxID=1965333 RepID=UPI001A033F87|nr:hypothetical protein [Prosthecobacter sp.]MBE2285459.1 hypothetical protein [Prosthecobacter sp.]
MPVICNDAARCEVMNLAWGPGGHGPYLVRQEGYAPGSSTFKMQRFILQKDGRWLLNLAFVMLPEAEQEAQLFHSLTEVLQMFEGLSSKPVSAHAHLPAGANADEILAHFEQCTHRILRGMRTCSTVPLK